jgi:hypothetical protein
LSFRSQLADGSLAARREAFESVAPQIGTEIRAEVEAATSTLGSQPSHQLFAWAQRQQQLTHHAGGATGTIDDAYGIAFTADRKLAVGYADSLSVPSTRPRYMLHVKARDSGYIGERLGTTQQLEAYRMGFVPSDDAVALYTRPTEQSAWFKLQRHDSCSIEVMLATGDDLAQTQSLGLVSKQNLSADIAALRAQHADLGAVADAIETAMTVDTP